MFIFCGRGGFPRLFLCQHPRQLRRPKKSARLISWKWVSRVAPSAVRPIGRELFEAQKGRCVCGIQDAAYGILRSANLPALDSGVSAGAAIP